MQKRLIDVLDYSSLCTSKIAFVLHIESGGVENVAFSEQGVINYLSRKRHNKLEKRDFELM